jgi:hypothetical protein
MLEGSLVLVLHCGTACFCCRLFVRKEKKKRNQVGFLDSEISIPAVRPFPFDVFPDSG